MTGETPNSYLRMRYVADRLAAVSLVVLLAPVLVCVGLAVLVTSGRPVLFRQRRVGLGGSDFDLIKFRTMVRDAEEVAGGHVRDRTELITPVGAVLRTYSLDELPQLLNIAKGDMALIGPRPALRYQYDRYTPEQRRRVSVLPGLTGLAQVRYRNDAPWSQRILLDLQYAESASPRLDLSILLGTVKRVVGGSSVANLSVNAVDDLGDGPRDVQDL